MHILITGGTGFIGRALCYSLLTNGHTLWVLTRDKERAAQRLPMEGIHFIQSLAEIKPTDNFDAAINLAGAPIAKFWTKRYKQILQKSRVELTQQLVAALKILNVPPKVLISGSAIGFYGAQGSNELCETSLANPGFGHDLCQAWEQAAKPATSFGIRLCIIRTGIVLGPNGGILERMRLPFLLGLGGPIGRGSQWMSWIHLDDLVRIILFCLEHSDIEGPINATAPNPENNEVFAQHYAKVLHRPAKIRIPALLLLLFYGQMAEELMLTGQRVMPKKLVQKGFTFLYPQLPKALEHSIRVI